KRYASAGALADELSRYLRGEPILARRQGRTERLWRWCRRHRLVAALLAAITLTLVAGTAIASGPAFFALANANRAVEEKQRADRKAEEAEVEAAHTREEQRTSQRLLYDAHMNLAQRAWEDGDVGRLLELLAGHDPGTTGVEDLRGFEWYYWQR